MKENELMIVFGGQNYLYFEGGEHSGDVHISKILQVWKLWKCWQ